MPQIKPAYGEAWVLCLNLDLTILLHIVRPALSAKIQ